MTAGPPTPDDERGLLETIADTALDDDYYVVRSGSHEQSRRFNTVLTGLVMAMFALLVSIAAIQTRTDRPEAQRERTTLISDIDSRKALQERRDATAEKLRRQVEDLKASSVGLDSAYEELRLLASDRAAAGPGLRVQVGAGSTGRAITDRDLQRIVNGLWYAGAEAIAINGKRIGSLTSIRTAAGVIKVNYQPVGEPYKITALGDPDALRDRFRQTVVGRDWEARQKGAGVQFDVARSDDLSVEATPKVRLTINHAEAIEGDA